MSVVLEVFNRACDRAFTPINELPPVEWIERYGWVASGSGAAEPGPYSFERTPFWREVVEVMCDEDHSDVVIRKPAQVGYSELLNQVLQYWIVESPSSMLMIRPSIVDARDYMRERIDQLVAESPMLRAKIHSEGGRRVSDDTISRKFFPGGFFVIVGANSAVGVRGRPIRRVLGDEVSAWAHDPKQQGDTWTLAARRTATYRHRGKRIRGSTPGDEGTCQVTVALEESDWREWHMACPSCGHRAPFEWRAHDGMYRLQCDKDAAGAFIPETARYLCTSCGVLIPPSEQPRMVQSGRWVARFPGRSTVGFDVGPALISPWESWQNIAREWVAASRDATKMRAFETQILGRPSTSQAEKVDVHVLSSRMEVCDPVPPRIGALFGAVDVQVDRVETLVIGVAAQPMVESADASPIVRQTEQIETWILQWEQHNGSPDTSREPWNAAWEALTRITGARLVAIAVDTNFLTDTVWKVIEEWNAKRVAHVIGTKGIDGRGRPWITPPAPQKRRRVHHPWMLAADVAKDALDIRLRIPTVPGGPPVPGAIRYASTLSPVFFDGLTSEEKSLKVVRGRLVRAWTKKRPDLNNEPLDLTIMALGACYSRGPGFLAQLTEMAAQRTIVNPTPAPAHAGYGMVSGGVDW